MEEKGWGEKLNKPCNCGKTLEYIPHFDEECTAHYACRACGNTDGMADKNTETLELDTTEGNAARWGG